MKRMGFGIVGAIAAAIAPMLLAWTPAAASGGSVAGSYTLTDLGQGGWGGGPLYSDGSVGGGGAFSYGNGQNVGSIQGESWAPAGQGTVQICFTDTARKGELLFPSPSCVVLPANGTPVVISEEPGERTLVRVHLNS